MSAPKLTPKGVEHVERVQARPTSHTVWLFQWTRVLSSGLLHPKTAAERIVRESSAIEYLVGPVAVARWYQGDPPEELRSAEAARRALADALLPAIEDIDKRRRRLQDERDRLFALRHRMLDGEDLACR